MGKGECEEIHGARGSTSGIHKQRLSVDFKSIRGGGRAGPVDLKTFPNTKLTNEDRNNANSYS